MNRVLVLAFAAVLLFASIAAAKNEKPVPQVKHKPPVVSTAKTTPPASHVVRHRTRVAGTITALDSASMTVQPKTRAAVKGQKPPTAPAPVTITLTDKTKWYFNGKPGSATDFAVGGKVVVRLSPAGEGMVALGVADTKSVGMLFGATHPAQGVGKAHHTTHNGSAGGSKGK